MSSLYSIYKSKYKDRWALNWSDFGTSQRVDKIKSEFAKKTEEPLFIYMNSVEPHWPYLPAKFFNEFKPSGTTNTEIREVLETNLMEQTLGQGTKLTDKQTKILTALYDAEIKYLDYKIGELHDFLDANNHFHNTILIVTADHGESLGTESVY